MHEERDVNIPATVRAVEEYLEYVKSSILVNGDFKGKTIVKHLSSVKIPPSAWPLGGCT
ncbi:hypothetical protein K439DRAFT_1632853 [Ramaria rubella]|nr:hypothetical protein K439DRAFT_1632853 [Ramaria rubella]